MIIFLFLLLFNRNNLNFIGKEAENPFFPSLPVGLNGQVVAISMRF